MIIYIAPVSRIMKIIFSTKFKKHKIGGMGRRSNARILNEVLEEDHIDFCILKWWRINNPRYSILVDVARNVLSILISTVPLESAFSVGGCILDSFRNSWRSSDIWRYWARYNFVLQYLLICDVWINFSLEYFFSHILICILSICRVGTISNKGKGEKMS